MSVLIAVSVVIVIIHQYKNIPTKKKIADSGDIDGKILMAMIKLFIFRWNR